jgi:hypothetical protein
VPPKGGPCPGRGKGLGFKNHEASSISWDGSANRPYTAYFGKRNGPGLGSWHQGLAPSRYCRDAFLCPFDFSADSREG